MCLSLFQAAWSWCGWFRSQCLLQTARQGKGLSIESLASQNDASQHRCLFTLRETQKFQLFTELLASDNLKSLLSREFRWFSNHKSEGNGTYPYGRASTFAQEIKKVETSSGNNALDECRIVISEMGNVIALARLIRAAKRRVSSDEMPFLSSYVAPAMGSRNETETNAKADVDDAIASVLQKQDPDFVRAYVNVFRGVIQKSPPDNSFMATFFCIVPALCLCWMDASIQGKEMMHKKNITRDGYYTDDGFAVGLAFLLSVLNQTRSYERYVWLILNHCHIITAFANS